VDRIDFEWEPRKAYSNALKHGVSFEEARSAFFDPLARIHEDPAHSEHEPREILVGHSPRGRLLLVSFTERAGTVRIISARKATRAERIEHEEGW